MIEILDRTCANGRYRVLQLPPKSETPSNLFANDLIHLKNILATVAERDSNYQVLFKQEEIKIKAENPLVMCGGLASLAYWGLVYKPQEKMSSREALLGIHDYLDELTAKKWLEAQCYVSFSAWSPWFIGVGFDYTYIIVLKDFSKCYLICLTDTD